MLAMRASRDSVFSRYARVAKSIGAVLWADCLSTGVSKSRIYFAGLPRSSVDLRHLDYVTLKVVSSLLHQFPALLQQV